MSLEKMILPELLSETALLDTTRANSIAPSGRGKGDSLPSVSKARAQVITTEGGKTAF